MTEGLGVFLDGQIVDPLCSYEQTDPSDAYPDGLIDILDSLPSGPSAVQVFQDYLLYIYDRCRISYRVLTYRRA